MYSSLLGGLRGDESAFVRLPPLVPFGGLVLRDVLARQLVEHGKGAAADDRIGVAKQGQS
jgi:hypothetical protein